MGGPNTLYAYFREPMIIHPIFRSMLSTVPSYLEFTRLFTEYHYPTTNHINVLKSIITEHKDIIDFPDNFNFYYDYYSQVNFNYMDILRKPIYRIIRVYDH